MADTHTVKVRGTHYHQGELVQPGDEITVNSARKAELQASGIIEGGASATLTPWIDSLGRRREHTGPLQQVGRPNEEPPAQSASPAPGAGLSDPMPAPLYLAPGEVNAEPQAGSTSPTAGTGEYVVEGKPMLIENPDSLVAVSALVSRGEPDEVTPRAERAASAVPVAQKDANDPAIRVQAEANAHPQALAEAQSHQVPSGSRKRSGR